LHISHDDKILKSETTRPNDSKYARAATAFGAVKVIGVGILLIKTVACQIKISNSSYHQKHDPKYEHCYQDLVLDKVHNNNHLRLHSHSKERQKVEL
jgi:hypothetical protein